MLKLLVLFSYYFPLSCFDISLPQYAFYLDDFCKFFESI